MYVCVLVCVCVCVSVYLCRSLFISMYDICYLSISLFTIPRTLPLTKAHTNTRPHIYICISVCVLTAYYEKLFQENNTFGPFSRKE